jgi:hypothetical protein
MNRRINYKINKKECRARHQYLKLLHRIGMYLIDKISAYLGIFDARAEDCERGEQENARKRVSTPFSAHSMQNTEYTQSGNGHFLAYIPS